MYLNVVKGSGRIATNGGGARGMGSAPWIPFPMPFWPAPNPPAFVRGAHGLRGLGDSTITAGENCDPLNSACVARNFERWVQTMAAQQTAQNRILRKNCSADPFRTPASCADQYPDVSEADLTVGGLSPSNPIQFQLPMYTPTGYVANPNAQQVPNAPLTRSGGEAPAQYVGPPVQAPPANVTRSVSVENVSRPGQTSSFRVGDNWRITVTGPAGQPVSATSIHNGVSQAGSNFGTTDSSGRAVLTGQMTSDTVGSWSESWQVGGQPAGSLVFTVAAAPAGSTNPPVIVDDGLVPAPPPQNGGSFLDRSVSVFGMDVPMLGVLAAVGGAFWFFGGRR